MTTNKILLAAGSAALWANFAFAQDPQPQQPPPDPSAPVQAPAPAPATNGGWRKFGPQQQAGNETPNTTPPYADPQQGPPPNYQGPMPPQPAGTAYPQGPMPPQGGGPAYQGQMPPQQAPNYAAYPPLATAPA